MRLNRYLASAGLGSRRACEGIITAGRVTINGHAVTALATTGAPEDNVRVDGRPVNVERPVYVLLNKPAGFLSSRTDPDQRDTVFDLLPADFPRVFHVGRLDRDSEGLLLLTNDGDFSLRLTHPRYKVEKEYEVVLDRAFEMPLAEKLLAGVFIAVDPPQPGAPPERVRARAESIYRLAPNKLKVILRQGLKRQIRLMFLAVGYEVAKLERVRMGSLKLGRLRPGEWRYLDDREVAALRGEEKKTSGQPPRRPSAPSGGAPPNRSRYSPPDRRRKREAR